MSERYRRNPNVKCIVCNNPVYKRPVEIKRNNGNVFCGQACYGLYCRKEKPCVVCQKPILAGAHKKTCSRGCSNTYRSGIKYKIGRPRDKVKYQRYLKIKLLNERGKGCEKCNYDKVEILQVHHKDKNRNNNLLENLKLLCPNCHAEEHYLENSWLSGKINSL
mgnify:CR=1 FL=1